MGNEQLIATAIKEALRQCGHQEISCYIYDDDTETKFIGIDYLSRYSDSVTNKLFRFSITISRETLRKGNWKITTGEYKTIVLIPKEGSVDGWNSDKTYNGYTQNINVGKDDNLIDKMIFVMPQNLQGAETMSHSFMGLYSFYAKTIQRKPVPVKLHYLKVEVEE